ncbi:hypothetical protein [Microlunatus parietis]|uniref:Uncharacterized protein n=1 Tax=Microlunatus parietis TaxID=682979 RepID=A0A7Y9I774_9ACTN|nr:hypothetical protein [Microlunatus parietis]NYE71256.1 hypothetical protein [Microlunatus parietis]
MNGSPRCRDRLIMVGRLVSILIMVGVLAGCTGPGQRTAAPPDDWRTEQYRDVTFRVPAEWGYAYEPGPDWCRGGLPDAGRSRPYVSLGEPRARLELACPALPDDLITEHVAVLSTVTSWPTTPPYDRPDGRTKIGNGFWEVIRTVESVRLRVISRDAGLAQQIIDSAAPAGDTAPCRPDHPVITDHGYRPQLAGDLGVVDRITLCQYELGRTQEAGGVRAAGVLTGTAAQKLIKTVAAAPAWNGAGCPAAEEHWPDLTVVLRVHDAAGLRELILRQGTCSNGAGPVLGGFDDGRTVRAATKATCRAVFVAPLRIDSGGSSVFERCVPRR